MRCGGIRESLLGHVISNWILKKKRSLRRQEVGGHWGQGAAKDKLDPSVIVPVS